MSSIPLVQSRAVDALLVRLDGVRRSGRGWRARCPSCGGRSTKVSIAETETGAVLLHAFCGCSPAQVLGAINLPMAALFPARLPGTSAQHRRAARRVWRESQWGAALDVLTFEATVVAIAARQLAVGKVLNSLDASRLAQALDRITDAREVLRGR